MIIIPDVERLIDHVRQVHESILANINTETATFENIILPLAIAHNLVTCKLPILGFYEAVSANSHLRDDSTRAKGLYTYFDIETKAHEGLFALIDAVLRKNESLDPESRRLLERTHRDYIRHGLGVPAQQRERFKAIQKQLAQLISKFEKNLRDHDEGIWFTTEELVGVPEDAIEGLKQADGKVFMTFDFPHLFATLKFASNEDTRRRYYIAHENRCQPNVALFKDIMVLRHEAAQLLGYPNHAAFRLEDKMAKKPEVVMAFLDDLHSKLSAGGRSDIEGLKRLKNANLTSKAATDKFYLWDYAFYNRLMLETEYFVDRKAIAEYFPLQTTVTGVMRIFEHLFGLVFEEIVDEARDYLASTNRGADLVWHEDVQMFAVWDDDREGGGFLGYLYLDLHPRPGKFGGMSNMNLQGVWIVVVAACILRLIIASGF
jgi:metallopeptidase MepB